MSDLKDLEKAYPAIANIIKGIYRDRGPVKPAEIKKAIRGQHQDRVNNIYKQLMGLREIEDLQVEMLGHDEENDLSHYISIKVPEKNNKKYEIEIFISNIAPYAAISIFVDKKEAHPEKDDFYVYREINVQGEITKNKKIQTIFNQIKDIIRKNNVETVPWQVLNLKVPDAQLLIHSESRNDVFDLIFGEPALFW